MLRLKLTSILLVISLILFSEIPAGYYFKADNKKAAELKTALHEIVKEAKMYGYGSGEGKTWQGFNSTDVREDGKVLDRYSNKEWEFTTSYGSVVGMHIEHALPKSWWGGKEYNAYKDLHHLFPSDGPTNSAKRNFPLGVAVVPARNDNGVSKIDKNTFGTEYSNTCFEPADDWKGDFARAYLYMSTAYEDYSELWVSPMMNNETYPVWNDWAIELLLLWNQIDPVSTLEKDRMEKVYEIQGNRNPFIDYPELIDHIWGDKKNVNYTFPVDAVPFLAAPNKWTKIDFGAISKGSTNNLSVQFLGSNLSSNLTLSIKSGVKSSITIDKNSLTPQEIHNGVNIQLSFTPQTVGTLHDTLVVDGGGITKLMVPIVAAVSDDFILLSATDISQAEATIHWIKSDNANFYTVDYFTGGELCGDLFISTYHEGTSYNKAIEIYNGTGKDVDLSKYSVRKQNNGEGSFVNNLQLSGTLANNSYYVIANSRSSQELLNIANLTEDGNEQNIVVNFNGNDAIALYRDGIMIDLVGVENQADMWGENIAIVRKSTLTSPTNNFSFDHWNASSTDCFACFKTYTPNLSTPQYIQQNLRVEKEFSNLALYDLPSNSVINAVVKINGTTPTANYAQIATLKIETPEILDASDIYKDRFSANWEDVAFADNYLLTVTKYGIGSEKTISENFNSIGSTGKPLPTGWIGTTSGNYTSASSTGASPNSIAFKTNGEYLQPQSVDGVITKLSFWAKWPSSGANSSFLVEGSINGVEWETIDNITYVNLTAMNKTYDIDETKRYSLVRFTYTKASGNFAFDDLEIVYKQFDNTSIFSDMSIVESSFVVENLEPNTRYLYTVKATRGNDVSESSLIQFATTNENDAPVNNTFVELNGANIWTKNSVINISNINKGDRVTIYNSLGKIIYTSNTLTTHSMNLEKGLYLVKINEKVDKVLVK